MTERKEKAPFSPFTGDLKGDIERMKFQRKESLKNAESSEDIEKKDSAVVSAYRAIMKIFSDKTKISIVEFDKDPEMRKALKRVISDIYDRK